MGFYSVSTLIFYNFTVILTIMATKLVPPLQHGGALGKLSISTFLCSNFQCPANSFLSICSRVRSVPKPHRMFPQVSGISGDGMADLLSLACDLSQKMLGPQLVFKNVLEAMVMEVKAIHGLGKNPHRLIISFVVFSSILIPIKNCSQPL